jgi:peptidoglycan hydrolase-like protein with peptidoglycan-binding domain
MKFNPTLPLALAISVGAAGAVMAQTAPSQTPTTHPSSGYTQPSTTTGQPQAARTGASEAEARTNSMQTPSATKRMPSATARRRATRTPSTQMAVNGNETVRYAQYRLHQAGLYNGPQDGIMDPNTRAAIARYQEEHGLRRSESLDTSTLASLESSRTTGYGSAMPPANAMAGRTPSAANNPYAGATGGNAGKAASR